MANVLYLTQDGITDHIGQAQIAPYILGLARMGHKIHVISAEKPGRRVLDAKYQRLFDEAGVKWTTVPYANKPPLVSSAVMLWRMYQKAAAVMAAEGQDVIHCRAYLPLELAVRLKKRFGAKLLVDFRDFWADVGIEKKPFKFVYRHLKKREPDYINSGDHIVTLTERAAQILRRWYPQAVGGAPENYTVIPCCADFQHFDRRHVDESSVERHRRELGLGEGKVLLYLGSIAHDYLLPEMMQLFKALLALRPDSKFLFVSNYGLDLVEREAAAAGVPMDSIRFTTVDRAQVPEYLALADLSVVFIRATESKAGCSPTKLAELFAMNVPVIANAGVGDMDSIVDYERNGSVIVDAFDQATLTNALERVLSLDPARRDDIRPNSVQFTLEEGVRRYASIYEKLDTPAYSKAA
ncbi:MAG TPA: glycosyltransferase [Allosphingosinicella sp.]|jgi:glycosyltransferase involved in cell wall biosynthesis